MRISERKGEKCSGARRAGGLEGLAAAVELPGVEAVVPDGVETAGDGRDRVHESVTHPDLEDGILLAEGLAGADAAAVARPDGPAGPELEDAAGKRYHGVQGNYRSGRRGPGAYARAVQGDSKIVQPHIQLRRARGA